MYNVYAYTVVRNKFYAMAPLATASSQYEVHHVVNSTKLSNTHFVKHSIHNIHMNIND
jgi:hypothetical protein